jgi:hypothetical protein
MAFTEATLSAQLNSEAQNRQITILKFEENADGGTTNSRILVQGVVAPYAGRTRWMKCAQSGTAAATATLIRAALINDRVHDQDVVLT